jgi:(p)ppGpp synthase/HD superfamily hydrolase
VSGPAVSELLKLFGPEVGLVRSGQSELSRATALAAAAHAGQVDKSGKAYILHPIRVMQRCQPHGDIAQIAAVLHDVVEDTWVTLDHLRELEFPPEAIEAVDALSHRDGERYFDYIERCSANQVAALVKLADLEDNSDPVRRFGRDFDALLRRYEKARAVILHRLAKAG